MLKRKKREFHSSELLQSFAKIYGFENKLLALEIKNFLSQNIDYQFKEQIKTINISDKTLYISIHSPMFRNDLQLKKSFLLKNIQEEIGYDSIINIEFI